MFEQDDFEKTNLHYLEYSHIQTTNIFLISSSVNHVIQKNYKTESAIFD